jgi:hypothetical protein
MQVKSQAAMEFLMTYGWAFVVVLVLIGTLVYFGVIDMKVLVPKTCFGSSDLTCTKKPELENGFNGEAFTMSRVAFGMRNNWADPIILRSINLSGTDNHPCEKITDSGIIRNDGTANKLSQSPQINPNEALTVFIYCSKELPEITRENFYFEYIFSDLSLMQNSEISISGRVRSVPDSTLAKPW